MRRIYYERTVYHVMARGNNRENILGDESNKTLFLEAVRKYQKRFEFKIYAYAIMDNHFHVIVECERKNNISRVMQPILLSYSCYYRNRNKYVGHVWQGRFKSKVIETEEYILECIDYIHQNPVKSNIVNSAGEYLWSSAKFYDDDGKSPGNVNLTRYSTSDVNR